jgi:DNA-binding NarL/FixJ family response regulator
MIELATEKKMAPITSRQREVVELIAAGCPATQSFAVFKRDRRIG